MKDNANSKNIKQKQTTKKQVNNVKKTSMGQQAKKKKERRKKKFTIFVIVLLIILASTFILLSDLFNIKEIIVKDSLNVAQNEIIRLSTLKIGDNMFKYPKHKIKNSIKTNPYIAEVEIQKHLTGKIEIQIVERQEQYMLQLGEQFMYIDGQGYMLKLSNIKINKPIITGYKTTQEKIVEGNRLCNEDLEQLQILNQLCSIAQTKEVIGLIESIDISDTTNYKLNLATEKKTVYFGDKTNINEKILWIQYFVEQEKGIEGEIFLNQKRNFFREKV